MGGGPRLQPTIVFPCPPGDMISSVGLLILCEYRFFSGILLPLSISHQHAVDYTLSFTHGSAESRWDALSKGR